jgi:hypothetical protein
MHYCSGSDLQGPYKNPSGRSRLVSQPAMRRMGCFSCDEAHFFIDEAIVNMFHA